MHIILKSIEDVITVTEIPVEYPEFLTWVAVGWIPLALLMLIISLVMTESPGSRAFMATGVCMLILSPLYVLPALHTPSFPDKAPVIEQMAEHGVIPEDGIPSLTLKSGGRIPGSIDGKPTIIELSSVKKSDDSWIIMWKAK